MNKIEEAVVSYNHDAEGTLDGVLINGTPIREILNNLNEDKGNLILADAHTFLKDGINKKTLHDLLIAYVKDRENNPMVIRQLEEEVVFLYILGRIFLNEVRDLQFAQMIAKRILAGSSSEDCITKTIENFATSYTEETDKEPMPMALIVIVFTALIGETMKMMKNPLFMISLLMDDSK